MSPLAERLEACYTGAVYDSLRALGRTNQQLLSSIRPLDPSWRLAGPVFTVSGHAQEGLDAHETLMQWTEVLSRAPSGHVVVCQANDDKLAHMGELSAETLQRRGIRGYVVDGGCRDTDFILNIGFRVWCRYLTPADVVGRWLARDLGAPIQIGEVTIRTGDYLVADRDGAICVPAELADEVATTTEQLMTTENLVRAAIRGGMDPKAAYLQYGAF
jgi:4-hydroxy-4-methyl-2-oxoglutarate aldolase